MRLYKTECLVVATDGREGQGMTYGWLSPLQLQACLNESMNGEWISCTAVVYRYSKKRGEWWPFLSLSVDNVSVTQPPGYPLLG